jgi:hypothetical protein
MPLWRRRRSQADRSAEAAEFQVIMAGRDPAIPSQYVNSLRAQSGFTADRQVEQFVRATDALTTEEVAGMVFMYEALENRSDLVEAKLIGLRARLAARGTGPYVGPSPSGASVVATDRWTQTPAAAT